MPNRQRSGRRIRLGSHCARLLLALTPLGLVLLFFLAALSAARAGSDGGNPQTAWALPQSVPAYLYQLTDVGGLRSKLDRQGLSFIFSYFGDAFDNPFGGVKQGPGYDSRFAVIMDTSKSSPAGREQKSTPASTASSVINSAAPISTI
jgi:carbohydrate-selective porin OprB